MDIPYWYYKGEKSLQFPCTFCFVLFCFVFGIKSKQDALSPRKLELSSSYHMYKVQTLVRISDVRMLK